MRGRITSAILLLALAFGAGRFSVLMESKTVELDKSVAAPVKVDGAIGELTTVATSATRAVPETESEKIKPVMPGPNVLVKLTAKPTRDCLKNASRRDIEEWLEIDEERMLRFQQTDPKFASRVAMGAADWKRTQDSGDVDAVIHFKFESAKSAKVKIGLKQSKLSLEIMYRGPNAKDSQDLVAASNEAPLRNGYGTGLDRDANSYHIVFGNPVQAPGWSDYSNFAFSVPFDWNGKSEISVDVFGLTENKQWTTVGTANLSRAN